MKRWVGAEEVLACLFLGGTSSSSSGSKRKAYWLVVLIGLSGVISFLLMSDEVLDIGWVEIQ